MEGGPGGEQPMVRPSIASSISELSKLSVPPPLDTNIPIHKYFRSVANMLEEAKLSERKHDIERAYMLSLRLAILGLENLPKHKQFQAGGTGEAGLKLNILEAVKLMEGLRPRLEAFYKQQAEAIAAQAARMVAPPPCRPPLGAIVAAPPTPSTSVFYASLEPAQSVAALPPIPPLPLAMRPSAPPLPGILQDAPPAHVDPAALPPLPPLQSNNAVYSNFLNAVTAAPPSDTLPVLTDLASSLSGKTDAGMQRSAFAEGGRRKLVLDGEIFAYFMQVAQHNTKNKIETCGILAGSLKDDTYMVTHVLIPKQSATTDSCSMTNEDEIFAYAESRNIMTFGWIHTHPTQDCFLSSVDMHTHSAFQLLLPEAVAVVLAPSRQVSQNFGMFALTDQGLAEISQCQLRGFHPHSSGLYKASTHTELRWGAPQFEMVDLRSNPNGRVLPKNGGLWD